MVRRGLLSRERRGREILFSLTSDGSAVLREATERVRGPHPFDPHGSGWTLVTFIGAREPAHAAPPAALGADLGGVRARCATGSGSRPARSTWRRRSSRCAPICRRAPSPRFHARELPGFAMADSVRAAWDIESDPATSTSRSSRRGATPRPMPRPAARWPHGRCSSRTGSRCCGPTRACRAQFMDADWPADRSFEVYWALAQPRLDAASTAQFAAIVARPASAREARPQIGLPHLPGRRPRQLVDDDDVLRDLVAGDPSRPGARGRSSGVDGCPVAAP